MNSPIVESIQERICFARCALCKAKMEHNLYLSGASFYYTPNWIECRDEFTKLIASCASVLRASNIFIYSFGGWRRVNSKQLAGHLNGDQICPEARKLLRQQGKEGRGVADVTWLPCCIAMQVFVQGTCQFAWFMAWETKPECSLRNAPGGVCVMRAAVWKPSVGHLSHSKIHKQSTVAALAIWCGWASVLFNGFRLAWFPIDTWSL